MSHVSVQGAQQYPGTSMPDRDWWSALWPNPEAMLRGLGAAAGHRALDVCCGDGYFTVPLARLTAPAITVGVDLDGDALALARRDAEEARVENVSLLHASACDLGGLVDGRFDFVLIASTIHGVPEPLSMMRSVVSLMNPGARLAVVNWHALARGKCEVLGAPRGPKPTLRMAPMALRRLADATGLTEIAYLDVGPYHYACVFERRDGVARDGAVDPPRPSVEAPLDHAGREPSAGSVLHETVEGNRGVIEAWNTVLFDKYRQYRDIIATGVGIHGKVAIDRLAPEPGERVLDIGCGFGDTTLDLARRVGPSGRATGVDAAARFIEVARREAGEAGIGNVGFIVADGQAAELGGPYDCAFSRMGVMFFASPVAALRNVRKSLRRGGRIAMAVWRRKADNPFLSLVEERVREMLPPPAETDQVTCGPGPFSMASADVVSAQLFAAGFERPTFERFDGEICVGKDVAAAIEFALALGPAGEVMRLAGEEGVRHRAEIAAALEPIMAPCLRKEGVFAMSSSWIVTARAV